MLDKEITRDVRLPFFEVRMPIRDMEAEFELEVMAEPDENGDLCILVVECEELRWVIMKIFKDKDGKLIIDFVYQVINVEGN